MDYKVFSATYIYDSNTKPEDIPVVKCPKCGSRMVPVTVDVNFGIFPSEYSKFPDGKNVRKIVTGTMWECEINCDQKVLFSEVQEG